MITGVVYMNSEYPNLDIYRDNWFVTTEMTKNRYEIYKRPDWYGQCQNAYDEEHNATHVYDTLI